MPVPVSPSIPTESSTAAPAGGITSWFKGIGDWLKLLSPAGASQYDTDWVDITLATGYAAQGSPAPAVRRIGQDVEIRGLVRPASGNFAAADVTVGTLPPGFLPSWWRYRPLIAASNTTRVRGTIKSTGDITILCSDTASSWVSLDQPSWTVN